MFITTALKHNSKQHNKKIKNQFSLMPKGTLKNWYCRTRNMMVIDAKYKLLCANYVKRTKIFFIEYCNIFLKLKFVCHFFFHYKSIFSTWPNFGTRCVKSDQEATILKMHYIYDYFFILQRKGY